MRTKKVFKPYNNVGTMEVFVERRCVMKTNVFNMLQNIFIIVVIKFNSLSFDLIIVVVVLIWSLQQIF